MMEKASVKQRLKNIPPVAYMLIVIISIQLHGSTLFFVFKLPKCVDPVYTAYDSGIWTDLYRTDTGN